MGNAEGGVSNLGPEQYRSTRNLDRSCRMGWLCRRTNCSRHTLGNEGIASEAGNKGLKDRVTTPCPNT